jgi:phosphate transport system substrate-binding protein
MCATVKSASSKLFILAILSASGWACSGGTRGIAGEPVKIDGSSTVYPLTTAVAEEFKKAQPAARIEVRFSGTRAGFEQFCKGQTDLQDASRPIEPAEASACESAGVGYVELPIAHDAITIILHSGNTWASSMTTKELQKIWEPAAQGKVTRWRQVRADWPDEPLVLFGPGVRSGTFDFFTHAIVGTERASRTDYTASEDDDEIVNGVAGNPYALGYVGYVHYEHHRDKLKAAAIDDLDPDVGPGPIEPSPSSVRRGMYRPLSRPLFIYVNSKRLERPEVKAFVNFYTRNSEALASRSGSIPLNPRLYDLVQRRAASRVEGSLFLRPDAGTHSLDQLLNQ